MNLSSYLPLWVDLMLKSAVLVGVALLVARFARQASAANRHLIWLAAFGQVLALPFLSARLSVDRGFAPAIGAEAVILVTLPLERPRDGEVAPTLPVAEPGAPSLTVLAWGRNHWRGAVVGVWLGVAAALLAWRMVGSMRLRGLMRRSGVIREARITAVVSRLACEQNLRRVELRTSEECPVAMTWGTWRPVVMLPAEASGWSDERLELVLRHELAHVARRDCLTRLFSQLACALYWPNPLVWLAARRLRLAQEQACDDRVLAAGVEAPVYAAELLAAAHAWGSRASCATAVSMAEPSTLERRILGVLGVGRRDVVRRRAWVGAWAAAGVVLAGCSTVRVGDRAPASSTVDATVRSLGSGEPAAPPGVPAPPTDIRQVTVDVRFVELKTDGAEFDEATFFQGALTPGATTSAAVLGHLPSEEASRRVRELSARLGTDVLSAPRVTVLNENRAMIVVAQELRYPRFFDVPVAQQGEAAEFESRNVGVEASVLPKILSDGSVALEVRTMVREFEGFLSNGPGGGGRVTPGPGESVAGVADTEIMVPVFAERADAAAVVLRPGQVAVLRANAKKKVVPENAPEWARTAVSPDAGKNADRARTVLIFIGAEVITPGPSR